MVIDLRLPAERKDSQRTAGAYIAARRAADTQAAWPDSATGAEFDMSAGPPDPVARTSEAAYKLCLVAHIQGPVVRILGLVGSIRAEAHNNTGEEDNNTDQAPHTRDMGRDNSTGADDDRPGCQCRCQRLPLRLGAGRMQRPKRPKRRRRKRFFLHSWQTSCRCNHALPLLGTVDL